MVSSRHSDVVDDDSAAPGRATVRAEEICSDRRYVNGSRTLSKKEQQLQQRLEHVVEGEIIPRLLLLNQRERLAAEEKAPIEPLRLSDHVDEFAQIVLRQEAEVVTTYLGVLKKQGAALEDLLLHLMAPTARRLGEMWEADTIDFVEVTIGVSRLQQVLHRLTFGLEKAVDKPGPRALFLPTPSEQHTFGLLVVSEIFRRNGWDVYGAPQMDADDIKAVVSDQWFALVGFSLSSERLLESLRLIIQGVRGVSKNPSVKIIVGGSVFQEKPESIPIVGADLVATDAYDALNLAENALDDAMLNRSKISY